ncbi:cytochrome c oxidase assembly factor Coa1 family protein [Flavobacterium wongokense]|uniref:cytochrome c oxidase assembly factor Coa1 family protein n=1 Tax=Flavobacterium wongokense TaxID=2910674 RepID=UPI001F3705E0|nr:cytochrome c oxidase assembly factor Coa1 family protein [Flavobacterium sp. WG47]MCF6133288.1 cytochrome c oxidase assembly factor 1 family protein [Flavobacterium sp. WG47]
MEDYYPVPPKNWFQRNWKWFVPTGCLSLIIVVVLFGIALFKGITSVMKDSDVYQHSISVAKKNKTVNEKIGTPLEDNGMISGSINTSGYSGSAQLDIPIKGKKGEGIIHVEAEKKNDIWIYHTLDFYTKGSVTPISLLEQNP